MSPASQRFQPEHASTMQLVSDCITRAQSATSGIRSACASRAAATGRGDVQASSRAAARENVPPPASLRAAKPAAANDAPPPQMSQASNRRSRAAAAASEAAAAAPAGNATQAQPECMLCNVSNKRRRIVSCESCGRAAHQSCIQPKLKAGDLWSCSNCHEVGDPFPCNVRTSIHRLHL